MKSWTLVFIQPDLSSPQTIVSEGAEAGDAVRGVLEAHPWLEGYCLVAAIEGTPRVQLRDDTRWLSEFALLG